MKRITLSTLWFLNTLLWTISICNVHGQPMVSLLMTGMKDDNAIKDFMTEEDDTVSLVCLASALTQDQIVSITRATDFGASDSLLWNNSIVDSNSTKHIEFDGYVETAPGTGIFLYTMIMHNVTKYDSGNYACIIFDQSGNRFFPVASAQSNLQILHFPDDRYPICEITSAVKSLTRYVDDEVTFRCESEVGDPEVFLDWSLSARGPSIPRAAEYTRDRVTYSEIKVTLKEGNTGKMFVCEVTSGLDVLRKPSCTIGPYTVIPRPTTPRPTTTTPIRPDDPGRVSKSDNIINPTTKPTIASKTTESNLMSSPSPQTGLGVAAIAGIIVIIVLSLGIFLMMAVCWLIRTNKYWSPAAKSPISEKSPNTSHMSGSADGPQLLGFKKRLSKKASLKSETDQMKGKYGYENGGMLPANDAYATIDETGGESRPTTPLTSHQPTTTINPIYNLGINNNTDPNPSPSPTSPRANQPFLPSGQPSDGFTTPPVSPDIGLPQRAEESPSPTTETNPTPSPSPPEGGSPQASAHARNPSFISTDDSVGVLEGDFVSDSEQQETPEPVDVFDPSTPKNLPQDVMDILNDLDLDLFANEDTEDTML